MVSEEICKEHILLLFIFLLKGVVNGQSIYHSCIYISFAFPKEKELKWNNKKKSKNYNDTQIIYKLEHDA
jgi:hypothetical protein